MTVHANEEAAIRAFDAAEREELARRFSEAATKVYDYSLDTRRLDDVRDAIGELAELTSSPYHPHLRRAAEILNGCRICGRSRSVESYDEYHQLVFCDGCWSEIVEAAQLDLVRRPRRHGQHREGRRLQSLYDAVAADALYHDHPVVHKAAALLREQWEEEWRRRREAREGTCERCGHEGPRWHFQIHHRDRNRKNNSEENLENLCIPCHRDEHTGYAHISP